MKKNETLEEVLNISLPVVAEMVVYTIISIFDLIMIGKNGGNIAVSAVGISNAFTNAFMNIFISGGFCVGIMSLVSRFVGRGQNKQAEKYATTGLILGSIISILMLLSTFMFCKKILIILGARGEVLAVSYHYLKLNCIAVFFFMCAKLINAILIGYGNSTIPFIAAIVVLINKIVFNILFISRNILYIKSAYAVAISSVLSYLIGFLFLLFYIIFISKIKLRIRYIFEISLRELRDIVRLSITSSMEEGSYSISRLLCSSIIINSGSIAFAADEIANMIEAISVMPGVGFGIATVSIVGLNIGKRDFKRVKQSTFNCALFATVMMGIFAILFIYMPNALVKFFIPSGEKKVAYLAGKCLAIGAVEQPFIAISMVYAGALKGMGNVKIPFIISCFTSWGVRLPLIFVFIHILKYSVTIVWWITALQWGGDALLMVIFFKKHFKDIAQNRYYL